MRALPNLLSLTTSVYYILKQQQIQKEIFAIVCVSQESKDRKNMLRVSKHI